MRLDDLQYVTFKLESGNYLCFQVDTSAQCNVIPHSLYMKATKDDNLAHVISADTTITAYEGNTIPVVGMVLVHVWHGEFRCKLDRKLVNATNIRPLLGRKAWLGMKLISYLDS